MSATATNEPGCAAMALSMLAHVLLSTLVAAVLLTITMLFVHADETDKRIKALEARVVEAEARLPR